MVQLQSQVFAGWIMWIVLKTTPPISSTVRQQEYMTSMYSMNTYIHYIYICSIYRNCLILAAAKSAPTEWRLDKLSQSIFLLVNYGELADNKPSSD